MAITTLSCAHWWLTNTQAHPSMSDWQLPLESEMELTNSIIFMNRYDGVSRSQVVALSQWLIRTRAGTTHSAIGLKAHGPDHSTSVVCRGLQVKFINYDKHTNIFSLHQKILFSLYVKGAFLVCLLGPVFNLEGVIAPL